MLYLCYCEAAFLERRVSDVQVPPLQPTVTTPERGQRPVVLWFRRDLRLSDHPALAQAARQGPITAIFRVGRCPPSHGRPTTARVLPADGASAGPPAAGAGRSTHRPRRTPGARRSCGCRGSTGQSGAHHCRLRPLRQSARDRQVAKALGAVPLVATSSPYAAAPGEVLKPNRRPYEVFTPFYRSWLARALELPVPVDLRVDRLAPARRAAHPWRPIHGSDLSRSWGACGASRLGAISNDSARSLLRHPRSPCTRRDFAPLAIPQGGRAPPSHAARGSRARRRRLPSPAGVA